jgi:hypothetical protein
MGAYLNKYHIAIDTNGFVLGRNRNGLQYYEKKKAPTFVNKFGSGDSSYRDATFWQFFAQTNWRNGSQQLKWDDAGKFWKSENVNVNQLEKLTLSNKMISAGQTDTGSNVLVLESWRAGEGSTEFGDGSDGDLVISSNTTEAPIDSSCSGTIGTTSLSATNASFTTGQKILIHQSRGTGVGQYEVNKIASYTAGTITTVDPLDYTYTDSGASQAQVRVLKQYSSVTVNTSITYTAKDWGGDVGGILAFLCSGATTVTGTITATGKGFRGGAGSQTLNGAYQGEGNAGVGAISNRAANGSGGGAGIGNGGAGGGGGNGVAGSNGPPNVSLEGIGGGTTGNASLTNAVFGGGGGGGNASDTASSGGAGGGLVFIFAKTISVGTAVSANGAAGGATSPTTNGCAGGGGGGGSVLIKSQNATLGTNLVTASAGAGGDGYFDGGAGGAGRIHLSYLTSYSGTTTPTIDVSQDTSLTDNPPDENFTAYAGTSTGKIYSWDNGTTFTEVFDARKLTWYETGSDAGIGFGDSAGTEYAAAQSFKIGAAANIKSIQLSLKKQTGTPGNITVRIETNNAGDPSGTLVNANATATIPAFTTTTYSWKTVNFTESFTLSAATTYWIVVKIAAGANDNSYLWESDNSSATYADGQVNYSSDGGSSWTTDYATYDTYFRVLGESTSVNCSLVTNVGGTQKMLFGVGNPSSTTNGEARIISFDGTTWAINKVFTSDAQVLSMEEFTVSGTDKLYCGIGPSADVYETDDLSTYTLAKEINKPQNPGYIWRIKEYNHFLYAMGGSPEQLPSQHYNGFVYVYDTTEWNSLYPFDFTTIRSAEFYDAYLFMGTYGGQLFVYDTSSLTPIFSFKDLYEYKVTIRCMKYFDDKLYMGLIPQDDSGETNVGVWVYDRHGLSLAYHNSGVTGYYCLNQINNQLLVGASNGYVYRIDKDKYQASGSVQSSYFDANLPSIPKLYRELVLRHDPLPANTTITSKYKFKESDSWTTLGSSSTDNAEEATLSFAAGTTSNKITIQQTLSTTDENETPILTEAILKYSLLPQRKWMWNMRILAKSDMVLLDKTTESRTAAQIRDDMEDSQSSDSLVTFIDIDGTSYSCLFENVEQPSWVINQDTANENLINVTLIEA